MVLLWWILLLWLLLWLLHLGMQQSQQQP